MSYEVEEIADVLFAARKAKGWSQQELAKRSGIPQAHISKIEAGKVDLRLSSVIAITKALELEAVLVPRKALVTVKAVSGIGPGDGPMYSLDGV